MNTELLLFADVVNQSTKTLSLQLELLHALNVQSSLQLNVAVTFSVVTEDGKTFSELTVGAVESQLDPDPHPHQLDQLDQLDFVTVEFALHSFQDESLQNAYTEFDQSARSEFNMNTELLFQADVVNQSTKTLSLQLELLQALNDQSSLQLNVAVAFSVVTEDGKTFSELTVGAEESQLQPQLHPLHHESPELHLVTVAFALHSSDAQFTHIA